MASGDGGAAAKGGQAAAEAWCHAAPAPASPTVAPFIGAMTKLRRRLRARHLLRLTDLSPLELSRLLSGPHPSSLAQAQLGYLSLCISADGEEESGICAEASSTRAADSDGQAKASPRAGIRAHSAGAVAAGFQAVEQLWLARAFARAFSSEAEASKAEVDTQKPRLLLSSAGHSGGPLNAADRRLSLAHAVLSDDNEAGRIAVNVDADGPLAMLVQLAALVQQAEARGVGTSSSAEEAAAAAASSTVFQPELAAANVILVGACDDDGNSGVIEAWLHLAARLPMASLSVLCRSDDDVEEPRDHLELGRRGASSQSRGRPLPSEILPPLPSRLARVAALTVLRTAAVPHGLAFATTAISSSSSSSKKSQGGAEGWSRDFCEEMSWAASLVADADVVVRLPSSADSSSSSAPAEDILAALLGFLGSRQRRCGALSQGGSSVAGESGSVTGPRGLDLASEMTHLATALAELTPATRTVLTRYRELQPEKKPGWRGRRTWDWAEPQSWLPVATAAGVSHAAAAWVAVTLDDTDTDWLSRFLRSVVQQLAGTPAPTSARLEANQAHPAEPSSASLGEQVEQLQRALALSRRLAHSTRGGGAKRSLSAKQERIQKLPALPMTAALVLRQSLRRSAVQTCRRLSIGELAAADVSAGAAGEAQDTLRRLFARTAAEAGTLWREKLHRPLEGWRQLRAAERQLQRWHATHAATLGAGSVAKEAAQTLVVTARMRRRQADVLKDARLPLAMHSVEAAAVAGRGALDARHFTAHLPLPPERHQQGYVSRESKAGRAAKKQAGLSIISVLFLDESGHDANVCVTVDGVVKVVLELERVVGRRYYMPCYRSQGPCSDEERAEWPNVWGRALAAVQEASGVFAFDVGVYVRGASSELRDWFVLSGGGDWPVRRWESVNHHSSHALTGFLDSPFETAVVLSYDGGGNDGVFNIYTADRRMLLDRDSAEARAAAGQTAESGPTGRPGTAPWGSPVLEWRQGLMLNLGLAYSALAIPLREVVPRGFQPQQHTFEVFSPKFRRTRLGSAGKAMGYAALGSVRPQWKPHVRGAFLGRHRIGQTTARLIGADEAVKSEAASRKKASVVATDQAAAEAAVDGRAAVEEPAALAAERDMMSTVQIVFEELLLAKVFAILGTVQGPASAGAGSPPPATLLERIARTGVQGIVLTGGGALNVLANARIREATGLPVYVPSAPSDCGLSIGAAWHVMPPPMHHVESLAFKGLALEMAIPDDDFLRPLSPPGQLAARRPKPLVGDAETRPIAGLRSAVRRHRAQRVSVARVAELLAAGKTMGVLRGRQEVGPRALGHRSLIASCGAVAKAKMNRIKARQFYRPVAPMLLESAARDIFRRSAWSEYMSFAPSLQPIINATAPAVYHYDATARPQTVAFEDNPWLYRLLHHVGRLTGLPMLINTSFNTKGKPITNSVDEALAMLRALPDLDYVLVRNFLFERSAVFDTSPQ